MFQLPLFKDRDILPTRKYHISFSELSTWNECSFKHKLKYIDEDSEEEKSPHLSFGNIIHDYIEEYLLNKDNANYFHEDKLDECFEKIEEDFLKNSFFSDSSDSLKEIENWAKQGYKLLDKFPGWFEGRFSGSSLVAAEINLFESIPGLTNKWFKGFVDCVLRVPDDSPEGFSYLILDWKTSTSGWNDAKKLDKKKLMQLAFYKEFLSKKFEIPKDKFKTAFIVLNRETANEEELFEVVATEITEEFSKEALSLLRTSISTINKKIYKKNRYACRFCPFAGTPKCP